MSEQYRVGRKLGRTLYRGEDLIGMMDSAEDAALVARLLNAHHSGPYGASAAQADWWCRTHRRAYGECAGNTTDDSLCAASPAQHKGHYGAPVTVDCPVPRCTATSQDLPAHMADYHPELHHSADYVAAGTETYACPVCGDDISQGEMHGCPGDNR